MPYGSGTRLGLDVKTTDQSINLPNQLWLFSADFVDVDDTIGAGRSDIRATGIKRKMFCGLGQVAEVEHLVGIGDVDNFYGEFATGY